MSIAVSAVVRPSRLLRTMLGTMSAGGILVGAAIGAGWIGDLSALARFVMAVVTIFLSFFGFYHGAQYRKPIHIDITGTGQLRLTEVSAERPCAEADWPHLRENGDVVHLLRGTTLWPYLLLLHVQNEHGVKRSLAILPDCVSKDSFRALSVACRWMMGQAHNPKNSRKCSK
ncbi:protein YgfX [Noviherbaspirillum sp.]|uniref:protein YgfX n=1 Tax=Noviherbaspirillum sp. TaxID=1926288 RepID=UPI002B4A70BA|nr:protein YgfX [Noviherbaspirillum sp.]HJV80537.1 protein YgfX [Noviherbaspirillum sp.]